ncbi:MAG TPA: NAD-dependent epimerase/dehydratase family protein, partial [Sphingobium sp.]|nr:NAD-dependent epimerase/dehydratase family protein [Sphingobium sp.]
LIYDSLARPGVDRNLAWLEERHPTRIIPIVADIRDAANVGSAVTEAKAVFHLAAQVAVTTSLDDPAADFEVNLRGTFNVLESARRSASPPPVIFASTNKVYGALAELDPVLVDDAYRPAHHAMHAYGIDETRPLDFHTPYGCSKGAADQYVLDYARGFGLATAVMRMSCIYGRRQMGTEDQGWVAHFLVSALEQRPVTIFGDGRQVRDILDIDNAVDAYLSAWRNIDRIRGRAFNLGGGPDNAVSLRQVIAYIESYLGRPVAVAQADWRAGDQRWFVADMRAAEAALDLRPRKPWRQGIADLAEWLLHERDRLVIAGPRQPAARAL